MAVVDLLELPALLPRHAAVAGLDLGEKTIGVAVSDAGRSIASPLLLIRKTRFTDDAAALFKAMESREAQAIVIGLPVNMDGTEGARAQSCRAFARNVLRLRDLADRLLGRADVVDGGQPDADRRGGHHPRPPRRGGRQGGGGVDPPGRAGPAAEREVLETAGEQVGLADLDALVA